MRSYLVCPLITCLQLSTPLFTLLTHWDQVTLVSFCLLNSLYLFPSQGLYTCSLHKEHSSSRYADPWLISLLRPLLREGLTFSCSTLPMVKRCFRTCSHSLCKPSTIGNSFILLVFLPFLQNIRFLKAETWSNQ